MSKLWGGRFEQETAQAVKVFTESISYDYRLYPYDLKLNSAYAGALKAAGVLTAAELKQIKTAITELAQEIEQGKVDFDLELEDIHMNIEVLLIKKIGDVAKKIHTGKSRNDQVATDIRMYLKETILNIQNLLDNLMKTLVDLAEKNIDVIMPGYTHLQAAQPVLLAHHLLAYVEMFRRDKARLADCFVRTDVLPLGSAALAGTTFNIDRAKLAAELGFSEISENSMDAVSDRDFIVEFQAAAALLMVHLSRMSEELIIWNSQPFGFIALSDAFSTGSSIMPQKKNPDIPELVRGKTGGVIGNLMAILTTIKGLPLTYNRDLQEDKKALFATVETLEDSLIVLNGLWSSLKFNKDKMNRAALDGYSTATDLANYLVAKNIPFRDAHEITGSIVNYAVKKDLALENISLEEYQKFSPKIGPDIFKAISLAVSVAAHNVSGGTAVAQVKKALARLKKKL